jgi:hypothetical protein
MADGDSELEDNGVPPVQAVPPDVPPPLAVAADSTEETKVSQNERQLVDDLERILRYTSTAKQIEVPPADLQQATTALQTGKSALSENQRLDQNAELSLLQAIDRLIPRIYPATPASLEIAQLMEVGSTAADERQKAIQRRVRSLINLWIYLTITALLISVTTAAAASDSIKSVATAQGAAVANLVAWFNAFSKFFSPLALGFLGACSYILRTILQGLAAQTFVLRDGTTYTLRAMLGVTLGFMIPKLFADDAVTSPTKFFSAVAIPFLAGYAVEPMFAALDNIVTTIRDAVGKNPAGSVPAK